MLPDDWSLFHPRSFPLSSSCSSLRLRYFNLGILGLQPGCFFFLFLPSLVGQFLPSLDLGKPAEEEWGHDDKINQSWYQEKGAPNRLICQRGVARLDELRRYYILLVKHKPGK